VSIDNTQFIATMRYKNASDKDVDYTLMIQRSTGRFSETYTEEPATFPFLERKWEMRAPGERKQG
jgi:hypothetical protein